LSHPVSTQIESSKCRVLEKIAEILPEQKRDSLTRISEMPQSEINFVLDLSSHLNQFGPNLEFCFSLSPKEIFNFLKCYSEKLKTWIYKEDIKETSEKELNSTGNNFILLLDSLAVVNLKQN
jgi:hypothetical protein